MKRKHKKSLWLFLVFLMLVILVGLPFRHAWRSLQQQHRNRALITAVTQQDQGEVLRLLAAGADPNARDIPQDQRTFWQVFLDQLRGKPPVTDPDHPTALQVALMTEESRHSIPIVEALIKHGA